MPDSEVVLHYSYVYRFAALEDDTDDWTGVPQEHVRLIEQMAFEKALTSNIEDDPKRAALVRQENEIALSRLVAADQRAVHQRRLTPEIGREAVAGIRPRYQIVLTS